MKMKILALKPILGIVILAAKGLPKRTTNLLLNIIKIVQMLAILLVNSISAIFMKMELQ